MKGVVVCPQPRAADVGASVLSAGGNAFDALVAAAFSQMINDPFMGGIGGMGTLHYYRAATGESATLDFFNRAGSRVTPDMWAADLKGRTPISQYSVFDDFRSEIGYGSIMTPGTLAGLGRFHEANCTLPWKSLLAPAIQQAHEGVVVAPFARQVWMAYNQPGTPSPLHRVRHTPESARVYLHPEGRFYEAGEVLKLGDYGNTLERIARDGWQDFYTGALADEILSDFEKHDAFVTREDFASYKPDAGKPLIGHYRGHEVRSANAPGSGATVIEILQILDHFDLSALMHNGSAHLHILSQAMAAAHVDRNRYLGDPHFVDIPLEIICSRDRAAYWAEKIQRGELIGDGSEEAPGCTTHLTVWDEAGNVAALTQTLGTSAGVVTPRLGFNYNNSMKLFDPVPGTMNSIAPGKARTTGMAPTMLFKDGVPVIAAGAPGGSVIISAIVQAISNILDFGMTPVEAVSVGRIHCESRVVHAEATIQSRVVEELRSRGLDVKHNHISFDPTMARATVVTAHAGQLKGGSDPRGGAGVAYAW
jgi:gamma-glutamyltranspeptidase/glutathione hydrolase